MSRFRVRSRDRRFVPARWVLLIALLISAIPFAPAASQRAIAQSDPPKITTQWTSSVTQTSAVIYFETDAPALGFVDYGLTLNLGRVRPKSSGPLSTTHSITLSPLKPDTVYYWKARAENDNGQDTSDITFGFRTPPASATGKLVVTKTNSSGATLTGACFDLWVDAGGGTLGSFVESYCDRYDGSGPDGITTFPAVAPGSYVLLEYLSPEGYALARNVRFTIAAGETRALTVVDPRGGTRVFVTKRDQNGAIVEGGCFSVFANNNGAIGRYVAYGCDDYDGDDGTTVLGGLRTGSYFIYESFVPAGYVRGPIIPISVNRDIPALNLDYSKFTTDAGDNVEFQALDSTGNLVKGACFALFGNGTVREGCDSWDGLLDGKTIFPDVEPGEYFAVEHRAPAGYQSGKSTTFIKTDNRLKRLRFTQVPGGQSVTVKTLKGDASSALPGACYALYRESTGILISFWCDSDDGANDGVTRFIGIKSGTYYLVQTGTPSGYAKPEETIITVGSRSLNVTVRTYPGVSSASDDGVAIKIDAPSPAASPSPSPSATATPTAVLPTETPDSGTPVATETPVDEPTPTETPVPNASPIAQAGPDQEVTDADGSGDEAVTLDGSGSFDPDGQTLSYTWTLGGTEIASGASATVTLPVGTHKVVLTVTDDAGAVATDELVITVAPAPESADPVGAGTPPADATT